MLDRERSREIHHVIGEVMAIATIAKLVLSLDLLTAPSTGWLVESNNGGGTIRVYRHPTNTDCMHS
jgi:hypothetical protein